MSGQQQHPLVAAAFVVALLIGALGATASAAPLVDEWTWHRSEDGAHPDGREQEYLWLMNRARRDPAAEGEFLATIEDPVIQSRLSGFQVDLDLLQAEFAALPSMPPAAFDARLHAAARAHSLDMIARDRQDHVGQRELVTAAGFEPLEFRGNAYAFSEFALEGHAAFNVDWGGTGATGMQTGRPHRQGIMSVDGAFTNVGLAVVQDLERRNSVGPFVVTGNYAAADESFEDHYNRFLVGTVWTDLDGNGRYDDGEGIAGVTVLPSQGPYYAVTAAGGGYAIPVLAPGPVSVRFEGAGLPVRVHSLTMGATSVLVDYVVAGPLEATVIPEPAAAARALAAALTLAALALWTRHSAGRPRRASPTRRTAR